MMHNVYTATRETHTTLLYETAIGLPFSTLMEHRSMNYNATNRGNQKVGWESDTVIVPMISGNAEVGKDGTQKGTVQETHLLYAGIGD